VTVLTAKKRYPIAIRKYQSPATGILTCKIPSTVLMIMQGVTATTARRIRDMYGILDLHHEENIIPIAA
jgi:hypothetical protein